MIGKSPPDPVVVVMGATAAEPPPGIDVIADDVDLRYAPDRAALEREIVDAEVVYTWWGERDDLEAAWPLAHKLKWVAAVNVGIERLLFPALVESEVILTNARGPRIRPSPSAWSGSSSPWRKASVRCSNDSVCTCGICT